MTREEAKQIVIDAEYKAPDLFNLVDAIYNDFENRTCENCKWYDGSHKCNNKNSIAHNTSNRVYPYDGCREDFVSTDTKSH